MSAPTLRRGFGSDNHSGTHPEILQAILDANGGHHPSYGTDPYTEAAQEVFRQHFGTKAEIYFVFNGTAANSLSIAQMIRSYQSVLVTDVSHAALDECGAPEFFSGGKLIPLPSRDGKFQIEDLQPALVRRGDQHHSQIRAISITQPTELGTTYSLDEIEAICKWARANGLLVHLDGSRIANAVVGLQTTFSAMTTRLGVDVISFGGTKNGLLFGEAVVFLNPNLAQDFRYRRKQGGQLPSKSRFLGASFSRYLGTDLWRRIAEHQLSMAELLYQNCRQIPGVEVLHPRQSNAVFARIPKTWIKPAREKHFFYVWDETDFSCRWMCSWDTQPTDIESFCEVLRQLSRQNKP